MDFGPGGPGRAGPVALADQVDPVGAAADPPRMLVERLAGELSLTSEQRTKVEEILTARRARLETVQREVRERFDTEQQGLRDEIRAVLTPDQQQKFDANERERGRFGRRGPPR